MKDIKDYKKLLITTLENAGIPDNGFTLKEAKKSQKDYLGWYKTGSQLRSRPIIYIDIKKHEEILLEINGNLDDLEQNILDTMLHEYGHIVEEYVAFDNRIHGNKYMHILKQNFNDMEDFSELFAKYINQDTYIDEEKSDAIKDIIDFYTKQIFFPEVLEELKKPLWERELNKVLGKFEKSIDKLKTQDGCFDKCRATCEAFFERMSDESNIKILRLENYNGNLQEAHPKWRKYNKEYVVHYVLVHDETVIDFTAKQFDEKHDFPRIMSFTDLCNEWNQIEEFKVKKLNSSKSPKL